MSTPSSSIDEQPPRSRDLRDSKLGRVAILLVVLVLAGVAARSCGQGNDALTRDEAVAAAEKVAVFEQDGVQVRYLNQGMPPRGVWIVSLYQGTAQAPKTIQTVLVDAATGEIVDDGK